MNSTEGQRLAGLSDAIRQSTLKRLSRVPPGMENWCPSPGAMSFADIAQHLSEADQWLFRKLKEHGLPRMAGKAGETAHLTPEAYREIVAGLKQSGQQRVKLLAALTERFLDTPIVDDRFGDVSIWWVIVRGNLDHEAHHRGQLTVYLRLIQESL